MLAAPILLALVLIARVAVAQGLDPKTVPLSTRGLCQSLQSGISTARPLLTSFCRVLVPTADNILSFDMSPDSRCRWFSNFQRLQPGMYQFYWRHLRPHSSFTHHYLMLTKSITGRPDLPLCLQQWLDPKCFRIFADFALLHLHSAEQYLRGQLRRGFEMPDCMPAGPSLWRSEPSPDQ